MKNFALKTIVIAVLTANTAYAAPGSNSAYATDGQTTQNQDQTHDTFSFASTVACMIKGMAPDQFVGSTQYVAWVDQNKCDATASSSTGDASGSQTSSTNFAIALVTSSLDSSNHLVGNVFLKLHDNDGSNPQGIQVKTTIRSGAELAPPNGDWDMDYCASSDGHEGTCDQGRGFVRVNGASVKVYQDAGETGDFRSGNAVFTDVKNGKGVLSYAGRKSANNTSGTAQFAVAPNKYLINDTNSGNECKNPAISDTDTKFSYWRYNLYDSNGALVKYTNQGFGIYNPSDLRQVGYIGYWGANIWSDAPASLKVDGAQVADIDKNIYTLHKSKGTLEKIQSSTSTLSAIDGVTLKFGVWGSKSTADLLHSEKGVTVEASAGYNFVGYWDNANKYFVIDGYQKCSGSCTLSSFSTPLHLSLAQLVNKDIQGWGGYIDGVGVNYNAQIANWNGSSLQAIDADQVKVVKNSSSILAPGSSDIPTSFVCVENNCPNGTDFPDANITYWPPALSDKTVYDWDASKGEPYVHGTSHYLEYDSSTHHYTRLFKNDSDTLNAMSCDGHRWDGSQWVAYQGYCSWNYTQTGDVTYYNWRSGNDWDNYQYVTDSNSNVVKFNPPLMLSYDVPSTVSQGIDPSYAGKTITIQSPGVGELWLPGHCMDASGTLAECSDNTQWVNDVYIPTSTNSDGKVTLLDSNGQKTSTEYYAKWTQRGVYFAKKDSSYCSGLSLPSNGDLASPTISDWNNPASTMPWASSLNFDAKPKVIDGVLQ